MKRNYAIFAAAAVIIALPIIYQNCAPPPDYSTTTASNTAASTDFTPFQSGANFSIYVNPPQVAPGGSAQVIALGGTAPYSYSTNGSYGTINQNGTFVAASGANGQTSVQVQDSKGLVAMAPIVVGSGTVSGGTTAQSGPSAMFGAAASDELDIQWSADNVANYPNTGCFSTIQNPYNYANPDFPNQPDGSSYIETYFSSPQYITKVFIAPRLSNGQPVVFPNSFQLTIANANGDFANFLYQGNVMSSSYPLQNINGIPMMVIPLPVTQQNPSYYTYGVAVRVRHTDVLNKDGYGNYYFQLCGLWLGN